jgi:hypothetical protein
MLPTRRTRDKILKSLVRAKYDFGDGEDMKERGLRRIPMK